MAGWAIELQSISKDYGTVRAIDRIELTVARGEVFGYIGGNGAGKTTTLKILAGLMKPSQGDALICGHSILSEPLAVKSVIGFVPESGALFEKLSPREYLTMMGELYQMPDREIHSRVGDLLGYFGLRERIDQRMETFSKGTKQKICLISAIMHEPEVLFLDEPLTGLDVEAVVLVKDLIKQFAANGRTVFYTSHLIDIVEKVCDRIAVLHKGRLIGVGSVDEVRALTSAASLEGALIELWQNQPAGV